MHLVGILVAMVMWAAAPVRAEVWLIACDENFPPYNYAENGRVIGLDAEIVAAIVRQAGAEPRIEPHPWNRVQQMLERGEVDAAFQFVGRADRFDRYFMIGPHRTGSTVFVARRGQTVAYRELEDLHGLRIGVIQGYTYGAAFDESAFLIKDAAAGNYRQLVRMLAAGRVDLVIGDRETLTYFARLENLREQITVLPKPFAKVPRYIAVPRSKPAIADRMEKALAALRRNGGLAAILARWE